MQRLWFGRPGLTPFVVAAGYRILRGLVAAILTQMSGPRVYLRCSVAWQRVPVATSLSSFALPQKAAIDAVHIALAAVHGMDFLLTWNCTHIANAALRPRIESLC